MGWSWRHWLRSVGYAWAGIRHSYHTQANFRREVCLALIALSLCGLLHVSPVPVLLCCGLVLGLELVNTALEAVVDLCSPEQHPLARIAKDAAAAAVLVASACALLVGLWLFLPPLLKLVP